MAQVKKRSVRNFLAQLNKLSWKQIRKKGENKSTKLMNNQGDVVAVVLKSNKKNPLKSKAQENL